MIPSGLFLAVLVAAPPPQEDTAVPGAPFLHADKTPKAWALAAGAVQAHRNGMRHDLLTGFEPSEENVAAARKDLKEQWGVVTRNDLVEALSWIVEGGHRFEFQEMGTYLVSLSADELSHYIEEQETEADRRRFRWVAAQYPKLGAKSLMGWDYARFIHLCRQGVLVGHFVEDEAWAVILDCAKILQNHFTSWKELGENQIAGYEYWRPGEGEGLRNAVEVLREDKSSPWNKIPWDLELPGKGALTLPHFTPTEWVVLDFQWPPEGTVRVRKETFEEGKPSESTFELSWSADDAEVSLSHVKEKFHGDWYFLGEIFDGLECRIGRADQIELSSDAPLVAKHGFPPHCEIQVERIAPRKGRSRFSIRLQSKPDEKAGEQKQIEISGEFDERTLRPWTVTIDRETKVGDEKIRYHFFWNSDGSD